MIIETRLNFKKYLGLMFVMTYRKPVMIFFTLLGIILVTIPLLYFLGYNVPYDSPPYFQIVFGVFIVLLLPLTIYTGARKNFSSLGRLQEKIIYDFGEEKIKLTGESFEYEIDWANIYGVLELNNWILIYQNKRTAIILPKESFGVEIREFRTLVRTKKLSAKLKS